MKIAVFGGSFNPIHIGHIQLAQAFVKKIGLDKVLVVPALTPPHKRFDNSVSSDDRLQMCRLAIKDLPFAEVSDIEIKRGGESYTYLTLTELSEIYRNDELFLITGADMFMSIHTWKHPEIIFSLAVICGVPRSGNDIKDILNQAEYLKTLGAKTEILDMPLMSVSSTEIRKRIKNKEDFSMLVTPEVKNYIVKNKLYF